MRSGSDELGVEGSFEEGEFGQADRIPISDTRHGLPPARPAASTSADYSSATTTFGEEVHSVGSLGLEEKSICFFALYVSFPL